MDKDSIIPVRLFLAQVLMECAAVVSMATETVLVMETSLAVNHPHLSSISRVLAVVLPEDPLGITKFGRVYAFSCQKDCRCAEEYRGPWIIQMEGGNTITSIVTRSDGLVPMKEVQLLIFLPWIFFLTPVNRVFR
jgi:hypothetical protein